MSSQVGKHRPNDLDELDSTVTIELKGLAYLSWNLAIIRAVRVELEDPLIARVEALPSAFDSSWLRRASRAGESRKGFNKCHQSHLPDRVVRGPAMTMP
jgi:hypothetical protein